MGREFNGSAVYNKAVGSCPEVSVNLGGVKDVRCLLDTGAQVSTITESFFNEHLAHEEIINVSEFISITGAQGLTVPYRGYVLRDVNKALKSTSESRFQQMLAGSSEGTAWVHVLALYEEVIARKPETTTEKRYQVRSGGRKPILLPARCSVTIDCTTHRPKQPYVAIVEERDVSTLPNGLVLLPTLVRVPSSGRVPVQMVNFSNIDVYLAPRTPIGLLELSPSNPRPSSDECNAVLEEACSLPSLTEDIQEMMRRMEIDEEIQTSPEQREQVEKLIKRHYDRFSKDDMDIGYCDKVEHKIILDDDRPVRLPHRRIPPHQWSEVREYLEKSLKQGIIKRSSSPYASAVVLVRKRDGKLRLCIDYRALNAKTHRDAYPLPRIEEALDALKGAKYFCSLDLAHGFHQVPMAKDDREKTAFRVGTGGLYEFTRMPFGLCNAPATFMRLMDLAFGDQNFQSVLIYMDDILVFGTTFEETMQRLDMVLGRLADFNLKVKPEKCNLFKKKLRYLGHVVSAGGISPDPEKIRAVQEWDIPKTETELRGFLGLCSYYRRFVPKYAEVAAPLHALLGTTAKKKKKRTAETKPKIPLPEAWDEDCTKAMEAMKGQLTSAPVLGYPDFKESFILVIDASHLGLGAVLSLKKDGKQVVIAYASRALRPNERNMENYSSMKLELLALKWAVTEKFRDYLIGASFTVYTDNNPLSYFNSTAKLGATEMRWQAELAQFQFQIKYRPGRVNTNADSLSRKTDHGRHHGRLEEMNDCPETTPQDRGTTLPASLRATIEEVAEMQRDDQVLIKDTGTTFTLPTISKEDLVRLQHADEGLSKVLDYTSKEIQPTVRQLRAEPQACSKDPP